MSETHWDGTWVEVIPAPGEIADVAAALLELADDPQHVLTQGNGDHFLVAPYIGAAYNAPLKKRAARKKTGDQ